jgi:toluene monooxygenase system protein E
MFQAADEVRRIQRFAYRLRQLQTAMPDLDHVDGRRTWERAEHWQPLRELVERLLVTYDWGEAMLALNFVLKPAFDEFLLVDYARQAYECTDHPTQLMCHSLNEDCHWHLRWSRALVATALRDTPAQREALEAIIDRWLPMAGKAVATLATKIGTRTRPAELVVRENWKLMLEEIDAKVDRQPVSELDRRRVAETSARRRTAERRRPR